MVVDATDPEDARGELERRLGEQLNALISAAHALSVRAAAHFDAGLQPAAFHLARWLYAFGPTNASTLATAVAMDRSAVSRLVGQLRRLGFVRSDPDPQDRRGVIIALTPAGQQRIVAAIAERGLAFQERIAHWSDADLAQLVALLSRLNTPGGADPPR
ncbi:MarR family transcriptional regulator [Polyangium sp. y55x31]|uniref:MarR family winged helix-turn-helix transcriptional regulator n=1 Tax=Polyangium sp. y55x31 TaxID=3042688 RepID=UPI002482C207|nr:MarR family transcriptional regulator [Polyangium sp. y55x31]MDI1483573.1 MarR family transcriptional regulator [Polyangium sp. y55x31]